MSDDQDQLEGYYFQQLDLEQQSQPYWQDQQQQQDQQQWPGLVGSQPVTFLNPSDAPAPMGLNPEQMRRAWPAVVSSEIWAAEGSGDYWAVLGAGYPPALPVPVPPVYHHPLALPVPPVQPLPQHQLQAHYRRQRRRQHRRQYHHEVPTRILRQRQRQPQRQLLPQTTDPSLLVALQPADAQAPTPADSPDEDGKTQCPWCPERVKGIKRHLERNKKCPGNVNKQRYACPRCEKLFSTRDYARNHTNYRCPGPGPG